MDYGVEDVRAVCVDETEPQAITGFRAKVGNAQDATLAGSIPDSLAGFVTSYLPGGHAKLLARNRRQSLHVLVV